MTITDSTNNSFGPNLWLSMRFPVVIDTIGATTDMIDDIDSKRYGSPIVNNIDCIDSM